MRRLILLACSTLAGCTATPGVPPGDQAAGTAQVGRQCFWASSVTGFSDAGPNRALVNIGQRETWELTLSPGCPDVNWAMRIGIAARGGDRICEGRPAELLVPSATGRMQNCLVRSVRKLSVAEAAAARGARGGLKR
ncbi:MAG TPA: DUF6491 family protein [Sphingomicrobium sp.]